MTKRKNINNVKNINIQIIKYPSDIYSSIKQELIELYSKCEPDEDHFKPYMSNSYLLIVLYNKKIIGFTVLTPSRLLQKYKNYSLLGGLKKKGLFVTSLCGDNKYKGIAEFIFNTIDNYRDYVYLFLNVDKERLWLKKMYEKNNFVNIDYLSNKNKNFYIMRRYL